VDWLIEGGHQSHRIGDYYEWLAGFETALKALPEKHRQYSVLPLLNAYYQPENHFAALSLPPRYSTPQFATPKSVLTRTFHTTRRY